MSYFFDFFYTNDEKQAFPVESRVEEKIAEPKGETERESSGKMGSAQRKGGWLESWQFWKRSDNSGGPFGMFRRGNRPTGTNTCRKEVNEAYKPAKECDRGGGSKDANPDRGFAETSKEDGQSKAAKNTTKTAVEKDTGSSSACGSDHGGDSPLVVYNERPNGGKDVVLNMKKVEALKKRVPKDFRKQRGDALKAGVWEEKHSRIFGQVESTTQVQAVKMDGKDKTGPAPPDRTAACYVSKPKDPNARTKLKAIRQLPAVTSNHVQKRGGNAQAVPAGTAATSRQENVPKFSGNSADRKNVERNLVEDKNAHKQMAKVCETKTAVVAKRNVASNPAMAPRGNREKIDEKPSIASGPSKNLGGNEVIVKRKNIDPSTSVAQEPEYLRNVLTAGCFGLNNPTPSNASCANNPALAHSSALVNPAPVSPDNQRATQQRNPAAQVGQKGQRNGAKPPVASQGSKVPQSSKAPQSSKSHDLQCPQSGMQDPRCTPARQNPKSHQLVNSKTPSAQSPKTAVSKAQTPGSQQAHLQSPMPRKCVQQTVIPQNPSQIGPPVKQAYFEVVKQPTTHVSSRQTPSASTNQPANRRKAPGLAKPVKSAGVTPPGNGETTRQAPAGSGNVTKRRVMYSKDGQKFNIEYNNRRENLAVTAVKNSQGNKNAPKIKPELLAKQENPQRVKPVMKDASTSTCPQSTFVDAAVQVPDVEGNAGDEIQSLLVKRPWDTERVMKMQVLLDEKLVVIGRMREMSRKQRDELKTMRKRCKELETVIKASNMQGKPQLIAQVNELTEIKNELVDDVTNLTVDLEKERTNVKNLRTELVEVRAQLTAARRKGANAANQ